MYYSLIKKKKLMRDMLRAKICPLQKLIVQLILVFRMTIIAAGVIFDVKKSGKIKVKW